LSSSVLLGQQYKWETYGEGPSPIGWLPRALQLHGAVFVQRESSSGLAFLSPLASPACQKESTRHHQHMPTLASKGKPRPISKATHLIPPSLTATTILFLHEQIMAVHTMSYVHLHVNQIYNCHKQTNSRCLIITVGREVYRLQAVLTVRFYAHTVIQTMLPVIPCPCQPNGPLLPAHTAVSVRRCMHVLGGTKGPGKFFCHRTWGENY